MLSTHTPFKAYGIAVEKAITMKALRFQATDT